MEDFSRNISNNINNLEEDKNKQESIKTGIDFVFEQSPELLSIGNKEEYSQYVKTIFPESTVRDIVYHGSKDPNIENFNTISNWTPKGSAKFLIKQETSKGLYTSKSMDFLVQEFKKYNRVEKIYPLVINIKNPDVRTGIVNSNDTEISIIEKLQSTYDSIISDEGGIQNTVIVFESEQTYILGSKDDMKKFEEFIKGQN